MVDFGALPPEINSARMYMGPGSSSFQVAASAWNGLAAELQSAAQGYETMITQLSSDEWTGPASAAMASAAQPYIDWMQETAAQAEQAATPGQGGRCRLRAGVRGNGGAAAHRGQPRSDRRGSAGQRLRSVHPADRATRGTVRRDVGAGRRGHVQLRGSVGLGSSGDAVRHAGRDHQSRRHSDSSRCGQPGNRHVGRQQQPVDPATADLVNAELAAKPCVARGGHLGGHHNAVSDAVELHHSVRPSCPRTSRRW